MHRYYMTAETRQALIEESNRLIAARTAASALRNISLVDARGDVGSPNFPGESETASSELDSAFARLVSELQSTAARGSDDGATAVD